MEKDISELNAEEEQIVIPTHLRVVWLIQEKRTISCGSKKFLNLLHKTCIAVNFGHKNHGFKSFFFYFMSFANQKYRGEETIKTPALRLMVEFQEWLLTNKFD